MQGQWRVIFSSHRTSYVPMPPTVARLPYATSTALTTTGDTSPVAPGSGASAPLPLLNVARSTCATTTA